MAIWVDDGIVCSSLQSRLKDIVRYLEKVFEMTYGDVECFVGIQIRRNRERGLIHISQEKYIERTLKKFYTESCYSKSVPADPHARLSNNVERHPKDSFPFREAVGSLMFAATCTRPRDCVCGESSCAVINQSSKGTLAGSEENSFISARHHHF
jgi:hypothetical protein